MSNYRKQEGKSCCTTLCHCFASSYLTFTNLIDLLLGLIFLSYGSYLYIQTQHADEDVDTTDAATGDDNMKLSENTSLLHITEILIFSLGCLLLFVALFGICGLISKTCQFCLSCTSYLLLPVILLEMILCVYMAKNKTDILDFLRDNLDTFQNFNDDDIDEFALYYNWILIGVGSSCLLHILRFCIGKKLRSSYIKSDEDEKQHLLAEKEEEEIQRKEREAQNKAKWDRKRQDFRNKYDREEAGLSPGYVTAVVVN